jgi:hypothetical protein
MRLTCMLACCLRQCTVFQRAGLEPSRNGLVEWPDGTLMPVLDMYSMTLTWLWAFCMLHCAVFIHKHTGQEPAWYGLVERSGRSLCHHHSTATRGAGHTVHVSKSNCSCCRLAGSLPPIQCALYAVEAAKVESDKACPRVCWHKPCLRRTASGCQQCLDCHSCSVCAHSFD